MRKISFREFNSYATIKKNVKQKAREAEKTLDNVNKVHIPVILILCSTEIEQEKPHLSPSE